MNKKVVIYASVFVVSCLGVGALWQFKSQTQTTGNRALTDDALLALIKNDQKGFETFIQNGGDLHAQLPMVDGVSYTVAQGMAYFDRPLFMDYLNQGMIKFVDQKEGQDFDILSLAIPKNNPLLLNNLLREGPNTKQTYGSKQWNLLHIASAQCAFKLTSTLHEKAGLKWDMKAKDGSTPLTLAAEHECLPMLSYWKEMKADFNKKDGRGLSAMAILKKKKEVSLMAFVQSFQSRSIASTINVEQVDFYKKRKIPKDQEVDYSAMIQPEDRPLESTETAEYSEFAD